MKASELFIHCLENEGVDVLFPGDPKDAIDSENMKLTEKLGKLSCRI